MAIQLDWPERPTANQRSLSSIRLTAELWNALEGARLTETAITGARIPQLNEWLETAPELNELHDAQQQLMEQRAFADDAGQLAHGWIEKFSKDSELVSLARQYIAAQNEISEIITGQIDKITQNILGA